MKRKVWIKCVLDRGNSMTNALGMKEPGICKGL